MKVIKGKRLKTNGRKIRYSCTNSKVILNKAIYASRTSNRNYWAGGGFLPLVRRTERLAETPLCLVPRLRKNGRTHNCTQLHAPIRLCGVHIDNVSVLCFVYRVVKNALYGDHVCISVCL